MRIRDVEIASPVVLAPMAGITDRVFRLLAKKFGCGLVYTEMISSMGLVHGNPATRKLLPAGDDEEPVCVQLFGADPEIMARAAKIAVDFGAVIVDINMGCPVPKVVRNGGGVALMRDPVLAGRIVARMVQAVPVPVTVKLRKGWDEGNANAVEIARVVEDAGAEAVAVHGRTGDQGYAGKADWGIIRRVREAVRILVIGNGDVRCPEDAAGMRQETMCDAVMVGRGALGNPWIFRRAARYLATGERLPEPSTLERISVALEHLSMLVQSRGERQGVLEMRKHAAWYIRGLRHAAQVRNHLNRAAGFQEMREILVAYAEELTGLDRRVWA